MKKTVIIAALAVFILAACQQAGDLADKASDLDAESVEWSCVQYTCEEFGTGIEWANANCETTENGTYCPIVQNGQQYAVPLSEINLTAITQSQSYCKQYRCVREAPARAANYTVNGSELSQRRGVTAR